MLANPPFADWVRHGDPDDTSHSGDDRFAACEQVVARRTNGLVGAGGRLQVPWPHALGTPPWGARTEIEHGASRPGTRYAVTWTRLGGIRHLGRVRDELERRVGASPALLYIGNTWLPRHVVLVLPGARADLDVHDPATGRVVALPRGPFVTRRLGIAGWDVPWCVVWPATAG